MAGQRGTERRAMAGAVLVRLPDELAARVAAVAAAEGLSAAAWLRVHAATALGADLAEARPSAPRRGLPPEDVVAVARLRESVGEAVGALVQAAIRSREGGRAEAHAEIEALLPVLREHARDLDRLKAALLTGTPRQTRGLPETP